MKCDSSGPFVIDADLEQLRGLGPWIKETLVHLGADTADLDLIGSMELAVHELAVNTIVHGYAGEAGWIGITVRRRSDKNWEFRMQDAGPAFDLNTVDDPTEPQVHGYGVMIARQLTTELTRCRAAGINETRFVFAAPEKAPTKHVSQGMT